MGIPSNKILDVFGTLSNCGHECLREGVKEYFPNVQGVRHVHAESVEALLNPRPWCIPGHCRWPVHLIV
jgi:hypothetical protein